MIKLQGLWLTLLLSAIIPSVSFANGTFTHKLSNVRDTQFTVSWITNSPQTCTVNYGTTTSALVNTAYDDRGTETIDDTHYITIKRLIPDTTYYYDIVCGGVVDNNNGTHYSITTGTSSIPANSDVVYGRVFKQNSTTAAEGAIIYIAIQDNDNQGSAGTSALASTLVDSNGYWSLDLVNIRTQDYQNLFEYATAGDKLWIFAEGALDNAAAQTIDTNNDFPAPDMILGMLVEIKIVDYAGQEIGIVNITTDDILTCYLRGYDAGGNLIGYVLGTWTILGSIGTITPQYGTTTTFDPTTVGTGTILVTDSVHTDTTDVITVTHGSSTAISLYPQTVSLTADDSATFTCVAGDNDGNTWTVTAQTTFTADDPVGTMTANVYQPGKVGTWMITGSYSTLMATATVVVSPGAFVNLSITVLATVTTTMATFSLSVSLYDSDGNPYSGPVAMINTTKSIIPNIVNLVSGEWTGMANISKSPNGGIDTITVFYDKTGVMTTATITVFMSSQQGGTITDKGVTIEFDPGDLGTTNVTVHIATSTQISQPLPGEIQCAGIGYNIALKDESGNEVGTQTGQIGTVTVYLAYSDTNDDGIVDGTQIKEEDLIIYQWENGNWKALTTWVEGVKNITWAYVSHFSTFTLGGRPTTFAPNNNNVFVYPSPYKKGDSKFGGNYIYFSRVSKGAIIKIYNIVGELIKEIEVTENPQPWKIVNENIASGIYIYTVTGGNNGKSIGKIGIIR